MRRYGDISIQYRYDGSRYVSWLRAIYRDTTLTFVIRGKVTLSLFLYLTSFSYRTSSRNIISVGVVCVKCLLELSGLFFIYSGKRWSKVFNVQTSTDSSLVKHMFLSSHIFISLFLVEAFRCCFF